MLDFGTSSDHASSLDIGDVFDLPTKYTYFLFWQPDDIASKNAEISGHFASNAGVILRTDAAASPKMQIVHGDGGATFVTADTALSENVLKSYMTMWDGSNLDFYVDGVADGTPALTAIPTNPAIDFAIGNRDSAGGSLGAGGFIGQFMYWHNEDRSGDIAELHDGSLIPGFDSLDIWHRGTVEPGTDESPAAGGTFIKVGTVNLTSKPVDDYYFGSSGFLWLVNSVIPWIAPAVVKTMFGANITYLETWKYMSQTLGRKYLLGDFTDLWEPMRDYLRKGTVYGVNI